jgi:hypothetical protein
MKKLVLVLLFLCSFTSIYSQQFHSLDGIEGSTGQTILIYRLGSDQYSYNPIIKFNVQTGYEQQIMEAHSIIYPIGADIKSVQDFEFFPGDTANFMNIGDQIYMDYGSYIAKNDSSVFGYFSPFYGVDISKQNPLKVFVFDGVGPIRSWDGGYTFPEDSIPAVANFIPIALADFDDNVLFGLNEDLQLARNGELVDTSLVIFDQYSKFLYDANQFHVYRVNKTYGGYNLNISNNKGNANTWEQKFYPSEHPVFLTIDLGESGEIYYAEGRSIYKSVNNGYSFSLYKTLPSKLVGIYKKPNSEILYAASKYKIYKVRPDTTITIKSLPIPNDVFSWFPLAVGNRWVYKVTSLDENCFWTIGETEECNIITKDTVINGYTYFKFEPPLINEYEFIRIDSTEGKLKTIPVYSDSAEATLYNFLMEVGDTILFDPIDPYGGFILVNEETENIFGTNRLVRNFIALWFLPPPYSLVKGIGYYADSFCEFGGHVRALKGCVVDGTVYGDTTFTDVEDEQNFLPTEYKLEQNYPNPFNPSTKISWQSPVGSWQTLKVFDILGREVATLVDEYRDAGSYNVQFTMHNLQLSSGIYFYQLNAGSFIETKKMILIK